MDQHWHQLLQRPTPNTTRNNQNKPSDSPHKKYPLIRYHLGSPNNARYFTQREWDVLQLIAKKMTIKAVGDALALSPRTVEYYLKQMREKCHVKRTRHLIALLQTTSLYKQVIRSQPTTH
jgi:DNA-binding NarL/FixJ family response regulator